MQTEHESVQDYYGKTLQSSADLQTNACCTPDDMPAHVKTALAQVHDAVLTRYYGCGLVMPQVLDGMRILDLGCGAGRDVYALAQLVGESGSVVGVDMTDEQLAVAREYEDYHAKAFGYAAPNTAFHKGYIEKLDDLPLEPGSFDIIVSNCVVNLATDKAAVLRGAHALLKEGGEMYFSDVYADRRVPEALQRNKLLYGECLSGALYWNDFLTLARQSGFADPRMIDTRALTIENPELEAMLGALKFASTTFRLFKLGGLELTREDYGQSAVYRGTAAHGETRFRLDQELELETGQAVRICGNTARMLTQSRFAPHFEVIGDTEAHRGAFQQSDGTDPFSAIAMGCAPQSGCCG